MLAEDFFGSCPDSAGRDIDRDTEDKKRIGGRKEVTAHKSDLESYGSGSTQLRHN